MTYRELNQIFYDNNKFDIPDYIINLEPFFYDCHIITKSVVHSRHEPVVPSRHEPVVPPQTPMVSTNSYKQSSSNSSHIFEPKQTDSIFWCIFAFIYGYDEYLMVGSKYGNRELEEKQKMITQFKTNPKLLKTTNHKITNGNIQEIYSEFMAIQNETSLMGVIAISVFYNIRILLVDTLKKTYLDFHTSNTFDFDKTCVLYKNNGIRGKTKYTLNMSMTDEMLQTIQNTMLCLEGYQRSLKSISNYKMCELEDICNLLGIIIDSGKRLKKDELYNRINEHI